MDSEKHPGPRTLKPLPCGGVPIADDDSTIYAYRCSQCFSVVGSMGMPRDCYRAMLAAPGGNDD